LEAKLKQEHKLKIARDYELRGETLHAIQVYLSLIKENPNLTDAYFNLADLYEKSGNLDSAVQILNSLLEDNPENRDIRTQFGQFLLRNSLWEEAVEVLSYVQDDEPVSSFFIGYSYFMLKDYELAKINFLKFVSQQAKNELLYEAYIYLAKIEIELRNFRDSLFYTGKAAAFYNEFWELNLLYAIAYYNLEMHTHAILPIEKAIKLNPKEPSVYEWAGKIYLKIEDYSKAERNLLKFIESIDNASSEIYTKLAEACLKREKAKDALNYYEIALKLDPENNSAAEGMKKADILLKKVLPNG
jgi:tetratricopeptide (TPR) repeat protein